MNNGDPDDSVWRASFKNMTQDGVLDILSDIIDARELFRENWWAERKRVSKLRALADDMIKELNRLQTTGNICGLNETIGNYQSILATTKDR